MENNDILVVGSGYMAEEYLKVIKALGRKVIVVGRGSEKVGILQKKYPEFHFFSGGLENYIKTNFNYPEIVINTVNVEHLVFTTELLFNAGLNNILLEKPGALTVAGISKLNKLASKKNVNIYIAYNRRFYSSVIELQQQAKLDGGILSAHFEFTEWIHTIDHANYNLEVLNKWVIANSSHVIDTVFHIIGNPKTIDSKVIGQNKISWHPSGSIFIGTGISEKEIPFSYNTNWNAPGRWAIEIFTKKHRLYLKPMETLQIQNIGSVAVDPLEIDNRLDLEFKPGLYLQTKAFLEGDYSKFVTIQAQKEMIENVYNKISGYDSF